MATPVVFLIKNWLLLFFFWLCILLPFLGRPPKERLDGRLLTWEAVTLSLFPSLGSVFCPSYFYLFLLFSLERT